MSCSCLDDAGHRCSHCGEEGGPFKVETEGLFSDLCPEFIGPRSRDDLLTIVSFVARPTWQPRMPWGPDQGPARAASGDTCSCQSPLWRPHRTSACPSGRGRSLLQLLFWGRHLTLEWPGHMWCRAPLIYCKEGSYFAGGIGEKQDWTNQQRWGGWKVTNQQS